MAASLACGGGGPAAPPAATAASAPAATAAPPPQPIPSGPNLGALFTAAKTASYKVTYRLSGTGGAQPLTGEQTMYIKPPNTRVDMTTMVGGQTGHMSLYSLPDGVFMCLRQGQVFCTKSPVPLPSAADLVRQNLPADPTSVTPQGSRQIAGQSTACFRSGAGGQAATMCMTEGGVPLYMESAGSVLEATSFSTSVSDADFTLPAQPSGAGAPGGVP